MHAAADADPTTDGVDGSSNSSSTSSSSDRSRTLSSEASTRPTSSSSPSVAASPEGGDLSFFPSLVAPQPLPNALADAVPAGHQQKSTVFEHALIQNPLLAFDGASVLSPRLDNDGSSAAPTHEGAEQDASADPSLSLRLTRNERLVHPLLV
jgi:hypothetical protein